MLYYHSINDGFIEVPNYSASINVYTVGCIHNCSGCHAKDLQNFNHPNRKELNSEFLIKKFNGIPGFYKSICWLGGDPFYQFQDCLKISKELKQKINFINVIYTGYTLKDFWNSISKEDQQYIKQNNVFDYIIDGKWNGNMLGKENSNQKIWKWQKNNDYPFIQYSYSNWKLNK